MTKSNQLGTSAEPVIIKAWNTATRLIKAALPEIKIVMLTTSTESQDPFEAIKSGAGGYLLKTMGRQDFIAELHDAAQGIPPFSN